MLTSNFHLELRFRMSGAILPLPHIPSWCTQKQLYLLLFISLNYLDCDEWMSFFLQLCLWLLIYFSTHQVFQKYWLGTVSIWLSSVRLVHEKQKRMLQRTTWHSLKWVHYVTSISVRVSVSYLAWHYIAMAWRGSGDQTKVSRHCD